MQAEMERLAKQELRRQKSAEHKEKVETQRSKIKAKFAGLKSKKEKE